jgi:ribosomal protein S12 methylthiotransferase accessory factor
MLRRPHLSETISAHADASKVRLPGTDRAQSTLATLDMAARAAPKVGITRVADITLLDSIGIPTFQAIRPKALTVAVSQGKGLTADLAKISAIMEAVEHWHVEQVATDALSASLRQVSSQLGYSGYDLPRATPSLLHDTLPLDWVPATSLIDGSETLLPKELVYFSLMQSGGWTPPLFFASTNGVASGNTQIEAILHGLYEVIERDAITRMLYHDGRNDRVDPRTAESAIVDALCDQFARARVALEVRSVASPTGLPCFLARITSVDFPNLFQGYGCHSSTEIALTRAMTEAAQARLAYVSGARDDLDAALEQVSDKVATSDEVGEVVSKLQSGTSLIDDFKDVVARTVDAFDCAPLSCDLTKAEIGVPVVRVVVPRSLVSPKVF